MKINTQIWTPIALSVLLPGPVYLLDQSDLLHGFQTGSIWLVNSTILLGKWYALDQLWRFNKLTRSIMAILLTIGIFFFGRFIVSSLPFNIYFDSDELPLHAMRAILTTILFLAIQHGTRSQQQITKLEIEQEKIKKENYKAQLRVLQANIGPHFLFNSLNTLRAMIQQNHPSTDQFILSLADFYRKILKNRQSTTLQLEVELDVLRSYLFLMENRNEKGLQTSIHINEALFDHHLPTLALQIVVENCFKHNSMSSNKPLQIVIDHQKEGYIRVWNNLQPRLGEVSQTGLGIAQLSERYILLGSSDGVIVNTTTRYFEIFLKLLQP